MSSESKGPEVFDGYIRVSRIAGRDKKGDSYGSPAVQEEAIRRWARDRGATIARIPKPDENVSGSKAVRGRKLEELIVRAERGLTNGIVVYDVSRFARDLAEGVAAIKRLRKAGARLCGVADGADSETNPFAVNLFLAIAEEYLRQRAETSRHSVERARSQGKHVAAKAPVGLLRRDQVESLQVRDPGTGQLVRDARLVPDPAKGPILTRAFEMRATENASLTVIADMLGIARTNAGRVMRNRVYLGYPAGSDQVMHEPLVTPELFAAVQATLKSGPGHKATWARRANRVGYLSGVVTCKACGHKLRDIRRGNEDRGYSYACVGHYSGGRCPAPAAGSVGLVDDAVVEMIEKAGMGEHIGRAFSERRKAWEAAQAEVEAAEVRLDRIIDATMEMDDRDHARRRVREAEDALTQARAALYRLEAPLNETAEVDRAWLAVIESVTLAKADAQAATLAADRGET